MNILYTNSSKQIHQLQQDFQKLEQGEDTSSAIQGIPISMIKRKYIFNIILECKIVSILKYLYYEYLKE